jgi:aspartate aminotransferase
MESSTVIRSRGLQPATRMSRLGTESAFEVLAAARVLEAQGHNVVHLEIGEPDFDTPRNIVDAGVAALQEGWTHYGPSAGLPDVRDAIAAEVSHRRGIQVDRDNVVITPGAKPIMFYTMLDLVEKGDEVIYPDPGFPIYESLIKFLDATPVPVRLHEENDFRLDIDELLAKVSDRTRLLVINSPHNPTGSVLTASDLKAIAKVCVDRNIPVLADEIYSRIIYDGTHHSIWSEPGMDELTIILDGMSKTYAMTGWRLGYGVMPKPMATRVAQLMTNSNSCTASFSQIALKEALTGNQVSVDKMVSTFKTRRELVVQLLNEIPGVSCRMPAGAFYAFANVKSLGRNAKDIADELLQVHKVATLGGTAFGEAGEGYLRLSYAASEANLREGIARIARGLSGS